MTINITSALIKLCPDSEWCVKDGVIEWQDEANKQPSEKQINDAIAELQAEYDAQAYSRNRQENYPNEHDLLIALWEKVMEGRSESADALEVKRQEVKTAHPKPE